MQYVTLNNGVKMPILGYGVYQVTPEESNAACWSRGAPSPRGATDSSGTKR